MEAAIDEGDEAPVAGRAVRMKRSPGGRHRVVKVLLTEEEHAGLAVRAAASGVSLQRYLIEAGMSGSVSDGAARRRAERELTQARGVLRSAGNNLNQLAKWANANRTLPTHMESILATVEQAAKTVEVRAGRLADTFGDIS